MTHDQVTVYFVLLIHEEGLFSLHKKRQLYVPLRINSNWLFFVVEALSVVIDNVRFCLSQNSVLLIPFGYNFLECISELIFLVLSPCNKERAYLHSHSLPVPCHWCAPQGALAPSSTSIPPIIYS